MFGAGRLTGAFNAMQMISLVRYSSNNVIPERALSVKAQDTMETWIHKCTKFKLKHFIIIIIRYFSVYSGAYLQCCHHVCMLSVFFIY